MLAYDSTPVVIVPFNSGIEISEKDQLVTHWCGLDKAVKVIVKFLLDFIWTRQGGCIGTDDSGMAANIQGDTKFQKPFIDSSWEAWELS